MATRKKAAPEPKPDETVGPVLDEGKEENRLDAIHLNDALRGAVEIAHRVSIGGAGDLDGVLALCSSLGANRTTVDAIRALAAPAKE